MMTTTVRAVAGRCRAHGCSSPVPSSRLFCSPHWTKLTPALRRLVLSVFSLAVVREEVLPTPPFLYALARALAHLAETDGRPLAAAFFRDSADRAERAFRSAS